MSADPSAFTFADAASLFPDTTASDISGASTGSSLTTGGALDAAGSLLAAGGSLIAGQANSAADLASAQGYGEESQAYTKAAGFEQGNVNLAEESSTIQKYQQQRNLAMTLGTQSAQLGRAGVGPGGSGGDLLRSSMYQGALASGLIGVQGQINAQAYAATAAADTGLSQQALTAEAAAKSAASSASSSGVLGVLGDIAGAAAKVIPLL